MFPRRARTAVVHGDRIEQVQQLRVAPARPGVSSTDNGRPRPSTARWIFMLSPPRERPNASPSAVATASPRADPLFLRAPSRMLMRPHDRGIHAHDPVDGLAVVVDLRRGQNPVPGPVRGPPAQPFMAGLPRPVAFRQVTPRRTDTQFPQGSR
jgi:hypothetical protein